MLVLLSLFLEILVVSISSINSCLLIEVSTFIKGCQEMFAWYIILVGFDVPFLIILNTSRYISSFDLLLSMLFLPP